MSCEQRDSSKDKENSILVLDIGYLLNIILSTTNLGIENIQ